MTPAQGPVDVLTRVASYAADLIPGGCHYPPPGQTPGKVPFGIAVWGPTVISRGGPRRTWDMTVFIDLIMPLLNETPYDVSKVDPLLHRIADRFSVGSGAATHLSLAGVRLVNDCEVVAIDPELRERPGGWYAPRLTIAVKFHRSPDTADQIEE